MLSDFFYLQIWNGLLQEGHKQIENKKEEKIGILKNVFFFFFVSNLNIIKTKSATQVYRKYTRETPS